MINAIRVHVVSLSSRTDRKTHIDQRFYNRDEFDIHTKPAIRHQVRVNRSLGNNEKHHIQCFENGAYFNMSSQSQINVYYNRDYFEGRIHDVSEKM
jgi:hypothetical protein